MKMDFQSNERIYRIRERIDIVINDFEGSVADTCEVVKNALTFHERVAQQEYPEGVIRADISQHIDGGYMLYLNVYTLETDAELAKRIADNARIRQHSENSRLRERYKLVETIASGKMFTKEELQSIVDRMD